MTFAVSSQAAAVPRTPPPEYRFKVETLATGMTQPMELEVAPDGRIFFNEIGGVLRVWKPDGNVVEAGHVPVFPAQENGFLGFALSPDFSQTGWIYLYYSPTNYPGQRLSRFEILGDTLVEASEKVLLQFPEQRKDCCHHAGSLEFAPDGNLFISTGDNTHPAGDSDGYAPLDERPGREEYDAQDGPGNTHDLRGKILRIRPRSDGTYAIPPGNLFPADGSQGRPEIYAMGCRNPWRLSVDDQTGIVYWGEVGPDAGSDGPRGPRGYDEINQARTPGNFGWPYFIGNNFPYARYNFATRQIGERFDPSRPVNESRSNTGNRVLPPAQPAFIYWPYGPSAEFPILGQGGRTACAGPVFHFRPAFKATGGFPEAFDNCLLFYDWQRPFVRWARLDADSRLVDIESFGLPITVTNDRGRILEAEQRGEFVLRRLVDAQFGADGRLYLLDYGETWGANADAKLIRVSYQWGNLAPVAHAAVTPAAGPAPLRLKLSAEGSLDRDGDALRYVWRLHPGNRPLAQGASAEVEIEEPGSHIVELVVLDSHGASGTASLPVTVGNTPPSVRFLRPADGDFITAGQPIAYALGVADEEDGRSEDADELMEGRVFVQARWSLGGGAESVDEPGLALMKQSDCFNCHAVATRVVGPPFLEVAQRYRGQPGALAASMERVSRGSSKVWGEVPMLPHPSLTTDQIQIMVRWVYSLQPDKVGSGLLLRGLTGEFKPPADPALRTVLLEASYTDAGHPPAPSLVGRASVRLRPRQIEAEHADAIHGARVLGYFIGAIDHGHDLRFTRFNLATSASVTVRVASAGAGGRLELHADATDGPLLAAFEIGSTGGWERWEERTSTLRLADLPKGLHDVVVVFSNPGRGGLMNLDWLRFNPAPTEGVPTSP